MSFELDDAAYVPIFDIYLTSLQPASRVGNCSELDSIRTTMLDNGRMVYRHMVVT